MAKRPDHLSPSAWNLWSQCERKWASHYLDHIREPASAAMEVGSFGHKVAEDLYRQDPVNRNLDAARHLARLHLHNWDGIPQNGLPPSVVRGDISEAQFKRATWPGVLGLFEVEDPTEVDVVATERRIRWTEGGVPFEVVVDRVERLPALGPGLTVVDYKWGAVPEDKVDRDGVSYRWHHQRQVVVGSMGVAATIKGGPAERGALLYVSHSEVIPVDTSLRARTDVLEAAQETWQRIGLACKTEEFEPKTGPLCGWCPIVADCPEGRAHVRRAESGGWSWWRPDLPAMALLAEHDAARAI